MGEVCCEGNSAKILQDTVVRAHYLGEVMAQIKDGGVEASMDLISD